MLSPYFPKIQLSNKNILWPPSVWNSWTTHRVHTKPIFTSSLASLSPHTCNSYYRSIVTTQCATVKPKTTGHFFCIFQRKLRKEARGTLMVVQRIPANETQVNSNFENLSQIACFSYWIADAFHNHLWN